MTESRYSGLETNTSVKYNKYYLIPNEFALREDPCYVCNSFEFVTLEALNLIRR